MRGLIAFWAWVMLQTLVVDAQDIKPVSDEYHGSVVSSTRAVDLSGLGNDGGFYERQMLAIHLMDELPVWVVHKKDRSSPSCNYWLGATTDGRYSVRLIHYIHPSTGIVVIRGVVQDLSQDISYEVKPDWTGQNTVTELRPNDLPPNEESPVPFWRQSLAFARNPWEGFAKSVALRLHSLGKSTAELAREDVTVDIMVLWTTNAECMVSMESVDCPLTNVTLANMEADINAWVADTNLVHNNSGTGVTFNVVHQQRDTSGYRETKHPVLVLDGLANTGHDQLGYIHGLRDQYRADLVIMIADTYRLSSNPVCGIAFVGASFCSDDSFGFSISDALCTSQYTPAHEFGHNMGCRHDRASEGGCCDYINTNYGYRVPGAFRTVMSYRCSSSATACDGTTAAGNCPRIPYFSGEAEYNGISLGGSRNNNREQIIARKQAVAAFR